jgi:hypothetical protein
VVYEDNDQEDLNEKNLRTILVGASPPPKVRCARLACMLAPPR